MYSEISLPREATVNFQYIFPGNGITYINKHSQEKWIILTYSFLFSYSENIVNVLCQYMYDQFYGCRTAY